MLAIAVSLHTLAAVIWVGGMFFAYNFVRPVAADFEPAHRLTLWAALFHRFFTWVWISIVVLLASGYWMVFKVFGGFASLPLHVNLMQGIGLLMSAIFIYLYLKPYPTLRKAVQAENWPAAGASLNQIRRIVLLNLCLGVILVAIATGGRFF